MRAGRAALVVAAVACVFFIAASPLAVHAEKKTMRSQCVVLFESFSETWCPACGKSEPVKDQLWAAYGPSQIAMVDYHPKASGHDDPFAISAVRARVGYYYPDYKLVPPTAIIDGVTTLVGSGSYPSYQDFVNAINPRLAVPRSFEIGISGDISSGSVQVSLAQTGTSSAAGLTMRYALVESDLYDKNGEDIDGTYHHVVRLIPANDTVALPVPSGGQSFTKNYALNASWVTSKLSFVAFIEDDSTKEVLQACFYGYGGTVVPEISPLAVIPLGGLFAALFIVPMRRKSGR